jgi:hypothetical protein
MNGRRALGTGGSGVFAALGIAVLACGGRATHGTTSIPSTWHGTALPGGGDRVVEGGTREGIESGKSVAPGLPYAKRSANEGPAPDVM